MKPQRLFQLLILSALLFGLIGSRGQARASIAVSQDPSVTININPASVTIGGTALASVNLNNVPSEGFSSVEFTCTYNVNLVEASNISVTNLFGANAVTALNGPQGGMFILAIAGSNGNRATTSGTVFTFNIKGLQAGQVTLECTTRISKGDKVLSPLSSTGTSLNILKATSTPAPATSTVPPTACDKAAFIADINVPPGTVMLPGVAFLKTWRFTNVGSCAWTTAYQVRLYGGELMTSFVSASLPAGVQVGQTVDISLPMNAPYEAGTHQSYWMFKNANDELFGVGPQGNQPFSVSINVFGPTPTQAPLTKTSTPMATQSGNSATPSVTQSANSATPSGTQSGNLATPSITPIGATASPSPDMAFDFVANACSGVWYSQAGQLPCPGTDGDERGFVLKLDHPVLESGSVDSRPGLLTAPQNIHNGYIQGIYPPLRVQSGDRFRATIGCEGGATSCYVVFRLDYQIDTSGPINTLWAFVENYNGQYYSADIDLISLAGKDVKFILTVFSNGSAAGDRALWVAPSIYRTGVGPTVTGQVFAKKPVIVSLYDVTGSLIASMSPASDGSFSFIAPMGIYSVGATAGGSLSALGYFTLTSSNAHIMQTINLPAGDIDNNNFIDMYDALTIGMNYNGTLPAAADLNNDGIINVLDLELLAGNYHRSGPVTWQ